SRTPGPCPGARAAVPRRGTRSGSGPSGWWRQWSYPNLRSEVGPLKQVLDALHLDGGVGVEPLGHARVVQRRVRAHLEVLDPAHPGGTAADPGHLLVLPEEVHVLEPARLDP